MVMVRLMSVLVVSSLVWIACGSSEIAPTSGVLSAHGENCTKDADCESGLWCVELTCSVEQEPEHVDNDGGNDGSGDTCGECPIGTTCLNGDCEACPPACLSRNCGSSNCPQGCGNCPSHMVCSPSSHRCLPDASPELCPDNPSPQQEAALSKVNAFRATVKLPLLTLEPTLNCAAQAHANYLVFHRDSYLESGLSWAEENPEWPQGFSGVTPGDRVEHFGFEGLLMYEEIGALGDPELILDDWLQSLYQRVAFLWPSIRRMGYGGVNDGAGLSASVFYMSSVEEDWLAPVAYPADGQTGVPRSWSGSSYPQPPLPPGQEFPSGPIITLMFPTDPLSFSLSSHSLTYGESPVPHHVLAPDSDMGCWATAALYAYEPLAPLATYTVTIEGSWQGSAGVWSWSFTTGQ
jgi:hypothetical protein